MRTPNQDPNTRGPQRVSNNNRQITHQIPTKCRWNELQDAYFTASKENIALSPDKNFLELSCTIRYSSNFEEGKLRRRSNVELFRRQTKLSELSWWKIRHLAHLSSSEWVAIIQRVLPVCFRRMDINNAWQVKGNTTSPLTRIFVDVPALVLFVARVFRLLCSAYKEMFAMTIGSFYQSFKNSLIFGRHIVQWTLWI